MSYNRKALKTATNELGKAKAPAKPKDIITDPMGQWKYPGENTRIPGSDITMQGVDYPVWAQPNIGQPQMMYPGQEYQFPGADYVDEFPQGGNEEYYEDDLDEEQIAELRAGGYVVEDISVPQLTQAKKGGSLKKYSRSLEATNKLFRESPLLKKAKSKKKKIFDPKSNYFDVGGIPNLPLREGRKAYERLGYTDNDRMAVAEEGGFLPQAQAGKATTSLILNPYEQGMFNTNVHAQGSNKPSFGFGVQRSNMFPRWAKENDVKTSMSGQVQIPYAMDRGPAIKGTARTAYSPNAGRGNPLDFTTQAQLEAGYNPNYGFNANVMAWPYAHGSNVPEARWKENKYYPGAVRAGVGPQAGFSYASDNKTFNGDDYMNPNRAGVHYGGKGFVEYTPTDWLKLKLEAQGMFDPIANKRDENAEIEGTKWKFSPGVNVSATVPLNFNKAKIKPNLQRKAQLYNDEIDGNFVKQASINSVPLRKNGGNINNDYIEIDADDNDIANYIAQGYEVEELPQAQYAGQTPFVHPNAGATQVLFQKPAPVKPNSKYDPKAPVNYQAKLKPVVADNTRDVTADEALAAVQNAAYMKSPEYKAKQKAEKEAQAKFEKKQWANYNKMSLGEKVLDRTNAALNQPLVMVSNLLMGEQAYIPGMAEGLGEDNINYDEYLKATGQSRGLSVNDVFNAVNPGNWGGHAGREYGKGNYVQGATELGLGLLGLKGAPMGEEVAKRYTDKLINLEQKAFKELPSFSNIPIVNTRMGSGLGMDMSRYEIKNPDYFTQLLDTYDSKALSSTNKKFYKDLIGSVKKQNGLVTERQYNELQRLKTGNFNFGKKGYKDGGSLELDLSPDEIQAYKDGGYIVEELPHAQEGIATPRKKIINYVPTIKEVESVLPMKNMFNKYDQLKNVAQTKLHQVG